MNNLRLVTVCLFVMTILSAHARMYQWVDPASRTTQFSGKPPVWYRSQEDGPRVFVFENSRIIDDTSIKVTDVERERLRQEAFLRAEEDREKAREKLLQAKRLQLVSEQAKGDQDQESVATDTPAPVATTDKTGMSPSTPVTEQAVVDEMRMLIQEWEQQRSESARALIGSGTSGPR